MSDVVNQNGDTPTVTPPVTTTTSDTKPSDKVDSQGWWEGLTPEAKTEFESEAKTRGFKSPTDFWKSYKEAEKGLSEKGAKLKEAEEFMAQATPVFDVILKDEALLAEVKKRFSPDGDKTIKDDKKVENSSDPATRSYLNDLVVSKFEAARGLDNLDAESIKEVRGIIGKTMGKWLEPGKQATPQQFESYLEDAFLIASQKDERLQELVKSARSKTTTESASMPSYAGESKDASGNIRLTPQQEKVAEHTPGGREAYIKGLRKLINK